ncbi:MAG: hypothetical protein O7F76_01845 [Planctomycetota bacterium]|nr:hypothetical protein [Planctomycetota bacterium]
MLQSCPICEQVPVLRREGSVCKSCNRTWSERAVVIHQHVVWGRFCYIAAALVWVGVIVAFLAGTPVTPVKLGKLAFVTMGLLVSWRLFTRRRHRAAVDHNGVCLIGHRPEPLDVPWRLVAKVRRGRLDGRVILEDNDGDMLLEVNKHFFNSRRRLATFHDAILTWHIAQSSKPSNEQQSRPTRDQQTHV